MSRKVKEKSALIVTAVLIGLCAVSIGFGQTTGPVVPWSHADVGSPEAGDAVTADGKIFEIIGAGADIWGTADNFHYMFIPLSGDGAMSVLVTNVGTGTSNWTKGGIMIRETLDTGSINVFTAITGGDGGGATFQRRDTTDAASASDHPLAGIAPPYWARLVREGNTFSGYVSTDGVTWEQEGASQDVEMADPVYIGLAVTSHTAGELRTVTFENIIGEGGAMLGDPGAASGPNPGNEASDVLRDASLSWTPGIYSAKHNIYVGDSVEDVNTATVPMASNLDVNSFDADRFEFGKTYFWRVDEVNTSPDRTVRKGSVWNFTAEPYSIQIPGADIIATASSSSNDLSLPENTINGSGLGEDNVHGIASETMWFTMMNDETPWIQYEFDGVKKLDTIKVWNSNSSAEGFIGYGVKDVQIEYSTDGETWELVEDNTVLNRAPGLPTYNQYDEIAMGGIATKMVRLNIQSNFGGFMQAYSLSEVQFYMIPAAARTPEPASGAVDILPNAVVSWRAGREAAQSTVYVSIDPNEVADGLAPSATSNTNSIDLSSFDLEMSTTYYWRVDEVNELEAESVWAGPVWSFSTVSAIVVEDFESYGNDSPDRPFQVWLDGYGYSADEFFPAEYNGNGTGAGIGHDIWSVASSHYNGDIMETANTMPGSSQSMPFYYSNSGNVASQTERTFAPAQDWTVGGAQTLSIAFSGQTGNTGTLYVKINNTKLTYPRAATNIAVGAWQAWNIDLTSMNVQNVTTLQIGVDGSAASGLILIDDIRLHAEAGQVIIPADPGTNGLVAKYTFNGDTSDSSGNGHNGTVVGTDGTTIVNDPVRGQVLSLPGGDDQYVEVGAVGISGIMPRTIACWAKAANTEIPDWSLIFGFTGQADGSGGNGSHFNIGSLGGPGGVGAHCWGWEETMVSDDDALEWHHYTMTYDGTTIAYFADGIEMDSDGAKSNVQDLTPSADRVHIGSRVTSTFSFPGNVDDAVIYDRVLTAGEILSLAEKTLPVDKIF